MSILIKGMEMPGSCGECKAFVCYKQWAGDRGDCFCGITKSDAKAKTMNADCPLVPVQPHGDLIDRNKLYEKTAEWLAEKVPTWVSVTERLPSAHELVLVYNPGYLMTTGFLYEDGRWRVRSVDYPNTPTHWMPLPPAPKEESYGV